jgi:hypothetical protein
MGTIENGSPALLAVTVNGWRNPMAVASSLVGIAVNSPTHPNV